MGPEPAIYAGCPGALQNGVSGVILVSPSLCLLYKLHRVRDARCSHVQTLAPARPNWVLIICSTLDGLVYWTPALIQASLYGSLEGEGGG